MYRPVGPYIYIHTQPNGNMLLLLFIGIYLIFLGLTLHNIHIIILCIYICIASYLNLALEVPPETGSMGFSGS